MYDSLHVLVQEHAVHEVLCRANGAHDQRVNVLVLFQHQGLAEVDGADDDDGVVDGAAQGILHHEHDDVEGAELVEVVRAFFDALLCFVFLLDAHDVRETDPYDVPAREDNDRDEEEGHPAPRKEICVAED